MINHLLIFLGAGCGGLLRYWVSNGVYLLLGRQFPFGTLIVNISGSLLMGFLFIVTVEKIGSMATELRALLLVGLLGGYTTFSAFSIETLLLFENGSWVKALLNIGGSIILCLLATWIGVISGRNI